MSGIIGIIIMSGLIILILKVTSIQGLELIFAGLLIILNLMLKRVEKESLIKKD